MRRYIKIISILLISIVLFNIQSVEAISSCAEKDGCIKCKAVCQYSKGQELISVYVNAKGDDAEADSYQIVYHELNKSMGRLDMDTGDTYVDKEASSLESPEALFNCSAGAACAVNVDGFGSKNICTKYAYKVNKTGSLKSFTCFDNDGKSCKEKYGNKVKDKFKYDTKSGTICGDGTSRVTDEGVKTREENEQEAVNRLTEQKIVIDDFENRDDGDCSGIFGDVITADINKALKYVQYIGPVLVIVFGILDFIKAVASGANDAFNDAWKRLLKRLIVAILLFFVVDLVKFLFHVFGITVPDHCLK